MIQNVRLIALEQESGNPIRNETYVSKADLVQACDIIDDNTLRFHPSKFPFSSMAMMGWHNIPKENFSYDVEFDDINTKISEDLYLICSISGDGVKGWHVKYLGHTHRLVYVVNFLNTKPAVLAMFFTMVRDRQTLEHTKTSRNVTSKNVDVDTIQNYMMQYLDNMESLIKVEFDKYITKISQYPIADRIKDINPDSIKNIYAVEGKIDTNDLVLTEQKVIADILSELQLDWNNWRIAQKIFVILSSLLVAVNNARNAFSSNDGVRRVTKVLEELADYEWTYSGKQYKEVTQYRNGCSDDCYLGDNTRTENVYTSILDESHVYHRVYYIINAPYVQITGFEPVKDLISLFTDDKFTSKISFDCIDCDNEQYTTVFNPFEESNKFLADTFMDCLRVKVLYSDEEKDAYREFLEYMLELTSEEFTRISFNFGGLMASVVSCGKTEAEKLMWKDAFNHAKEYFSNEALTLTQVAESVKEIPAGVHNNVSFVSYPFVRHVMSTWIDYSDVIKKRLEEVK